MRAELVFLGRRVDMAAQRSRRTLVVLIYAGFAALLAWSWLADHCRTGGVYLIFATLLVNRLFLGGHYFGGLVKPFNGKGPRRSQAMPSELSLVLRIYRPEPEESEYRNDERELDQRNSAHYQAYYVLAVALLVLWELANLQVHLPRILARIGLTAELAVSLLGAGTLAAIIVAFTLPQAILLWTEPDMEEEG